MAKIEVGRQWWMDVTHKLSLSEELQIEMGKVWTITFDNIELAVEAVYQLDLHEELTSRAGRTTRRSLTANALLSEGSQGYAQMGRSNSSDGPRGYYRNRGVVGATWVRVVSRVSPFRRVSDGGVNISRTLGSVCVSRDPPSLRGSHNQLSSAGGIQSIAPASSIGHGRPWHTG